MVTILAELAPATARRPGAVDIEHAKAAAFALVTQLTHFAYILRAMAADVPLERRGARRARDDSARPGKSVPTRQS